MGKLILEINRTVSGYGTNLNTGVEAIWDQFPNSDSDAIAIDGLLTAREQYRGVHSSYTSTLTTAMKNTIIEQVHRQGAPLASKTINNSLTELRKQMIADSASFNRPTVSASAAAGGSNVGDGVVVVSTTNQFGDPLDMVFEEDIRLTVTTDVSNGGTQYAEAMTVAGEPALTANSYLWPGGSGASTTLRMTDASTTALVADGGFETWVSTTPSYWTITVGAATVDKSSTTADIIRGTYGMKFTSDGSTLTTVRQQLSSSIAANKVYCLNLWAKINTTTATGAVRFRLTNSAGTTLTNDATTSLTYSRNVNGEIDDTPTQVYTFFQTPRQLPASGGVWLEIAFTTAPDSGRVVTFDHLSFVEATQLYAGGPFAAAFSKATPNALRDTYTVTVANDLTYTSFVRSLDRWCGLRDAGIYLPTATSETIADSLIG